MIINNGYFKNEIYIPHAQASITDSVIEVEGAVFDFVEEYVEDCLIKCLGYSLAEEFMAVLDSSKPNGLTDGANAKWDELLNGKDYTDPETDRAVKWKGIRYKSSASKPKHDKSFLAYYTYFFYEKYDNETRSDIGTVQESAENAVLVSKSNKVVKAWNKFVDMVQGEEVLPNVINKGGFIGIDYFTNQQPVFLSKFIADMNTITPDTYENFEPRLWQKMTIFN